MSSADEQEQATLSVVAAMVDAGASVMEQLHPERVQLARWAELEPNVQQALASGLHALLAPLATMLQLELGEPRYAFIQEGDSVVLRATVARANEEQAFIEFTSMEGPFSVRVPNTELHRVSS